MDVHHRDDIHVHLSAPERLRHEYDIGGCNEKKMVFSVEQLLRKKEVFQFRINPCPDKIDHEFIDVDYVLQTTHSKQKCEIPLRLQNLGKYGE